MRRFFTLLIIAAIGLCSYAQLPQINLVLVKQSFNSPVDIKHCGDDRLFIVEQDGLIRIMSKSGVINTTPFLDIVTPVQSSGNEQGLLGLAFSSNYKQDGYFYVNYIRGTSPGETVIARYSVSANDSNVANPNSEQIVMTITQPSSNHNGGNMMFGKDGYLYINLGDGGGQNDVNGYAQNKNSLLGKILRIDVANQTTYVVPSDNPFVGQANTKQEIWAYGLRNPWRASFDRLTGDMWTGDVGQDSWEEIDFQPVSSAGGENYGWKCREGFHPTPSPPANTTGCPTTGFTDPVYEVPQVGGSCSITGGYVYRGAQYSKLFGLYLFTDYCSGQLWSIKKLGNGTFDPDTLLNSTDFQYTSFGEDNNGEIYMCYRGSNATNGRIYHITETSDCKPVAYVTYDTLAACNEVKLTALKGDTLTYEWYNSAGSISGANAYQYAAKQTGWYKVKVSKTGAGCNAMSDSVFVTVHDTTALSLSSASLEYCRNEGVVSLPNYVTPTGGILSGNGISGNNFNPAQANMGNNTIGYAYTNGSGCQSVTSFLVFVSDTTVLAVTATPKYCMEDSAVSVNGIVTPAGGVYNSVFVSADTIFDPAVAMSGVIGLPYQYTNVAGCVSTVIAPVEVGGESTLTVDSNNVTVCHNQSAVSLTGFVNPLGGVYNGTGVANNTFNPTGQTGVVVLTYLYTNQYGCESSQNFNVNVAICSGIEEAAAPAGFAIHPNPAKGMAYITFAYTGGKTDLQIIDAMGKVCFSGAFVPNPGTYPIDVSNLSKGVYTVKLNNITKNLVIE